MGAEIFRRWVRDKVREDPKEDSSVSYTNMVAKAAQRKIDKRPDPDWSD